MKINDVINWETNTIYTYIPQYLKKQRQSDNEFWLVNRICRGEKNFSKKHGENEAGRLISDLILFFKKVLYEVKASG